jgi:ankyrin repeat protein
MKTALAIGLLVGACALQPALADRIAVPPARKPDYHFKAIPFTLSSWDSNSWAVEARVSGLVRAEGRRLILTFGDPAVIRRTNPDAKDPPTVITSLQVLLVIEKPTSFSSIARSAPVPVGRALPTGRSALEVEMPEEMTIELEDEPWGPLSPGLANTFLKLAVTMPGRDDKGVEHAHWASCYADAPRTLFADLLVDGGHKAVCARADTLRRAFDWDCPERVQQLVAAGANPHALDPVPQREEPRNSPLEEAVRKGDLAAAKLLLRAGADPNRRTHVYTPFELAASDGLAAFIEPMLEAGAKRDALGEHGFTPLMLAAYYNHPGVVAALLRAGVDPNQPATNRKDAFWDGQTALMYALRPEQSEVRRLLHDAGASPVRSMRNGFNAFLLAAEQDGLHAFREFLARGIAVNTPGDRDYFNGITPFMSTAVRSDVKNLEAMVKLGANPRLRDKQGRDALYWARHFKRTENAQWIERLLGSAVAQTAR